MEEMLARELVNSVSFLRSNQANRANVVFILRFQIGVKLQFFDVFLRQATLLLFNHVLSTLEKVVDLGHVSRHLVSLVLVLLYLIKEIVKISKLVACCAREVRHVVCLETSDLVHTW